MPLDSDTANADDNLHVTFFDMDHGPNKGRPFIRIVSPGDTTNVIEQPLNDHYKRRFNRKWIAYQMANGTSEAIGTPLKQWHEEAPDDFTSGQMDEMFVLKFQVVEQIANASDAHLQKIGMGGPGLRERARRYLASKNENKNTTELAQTKSELAELQTQMQQLLAAINKPAVTEATTKRKPGRPKRVPVNDHHAPTGAAGNE